MKSTLVLSIIRRALLGAVLLVSTLRDTFADVVLAWNTAMTAHTEPLGLPPTVESRAYAMTHIAMVDALRRAKVDHSNPAGSGEAAAAQAAHDVLIAEFPAGAAGFNQLLATQLAAIAHTPLKAAGIAIGAKAAADILAKRAVDGAASVDPVGPYTPGPNPSDYQFTPPFTFAFASRWGTVTPFVMKNGSQFRPAPPYSITSIKYTHDFLEVKALGSLASLDRSPDQTALALFWYENSTFGWNRIARVIAAKHRHGLLEHARLFAALNAAIADAYIASFDSKYAYNFWRPITAIRAAQTDGNHLTTADAQWEPLFITPPVPDYPSGHSAAGGAASAVLIWFFGDIQTFEFRSTTTVPPGFPYPTPGPRTFHRISDAAKENAISRVLVGIHFREACLVGYEQGLAVGDWIVKHGGWNR